MNHALAILLGLSMGSFAAQLHLLWLRRALSCPHTWERAPLHGLLRRLCVSAVIVLPAVFSPAGVFASMLAFWGTRLVVLRKEAIVHGD